MTSPGAFSMRPSLVCTVLAAYFYVFMEWLFFTTKSSFMTPAGNLERVAIFFGTAPIAAMIATLVILPLWVITRISGVAARSRAMHWLGFAVPAGVLAGCFFLLIDNFTYTIFEFGVLTTKGIERFAYLILIAVLWAWSLWKLVHFRFTPTAERRLVRATAALLLCSMFAWIGQYAASAREAGIVRTHDLSSERMPDILLLGSDGIEASHMSVYGFERDTTPFLQSWIDQALIAENAYPNVSRTSGSLVSMLTSKLATHTGVFDQFKILKGRDTFEHLPGILRDIGYRSIHVSSLLFADPAAVRRPWNMQNAFGDYEGFVVLPLALAIPYSSDVYFLGEMIDRIDSRVLHASGFKTEENRIADIVEARGASDAERIETVLDFMEASERPAFAHLHLLGTHKPYRPRKRFYTEGKTKKDKIRDDYDSAIRTFDEYVEGIVDRMRRSGRLDNTIIVVTSDHGRGWRIVRVPLIFFFPNGDFRGVITPNAQLLDVAPTVLDYIGVAIPEWMEGASMLAAPPDPRRTIFSASVAPLQPPPFANIDRVGATVCNQTTWLAPRGDTLVQEFVRGHTHPCDPTTLPRAEALRALLVSDLEQSGYDVSQLQEQQ
jgi:hypothetical protein